ncbi:hypothetical protein BJG92_03626 [Arthrobacter sp. SO5]|nr:hypothetical protein [Arthrobacter sp. SO5]
MTDVPSFPWPLIGMLAAVVVIAVEPQSVHSPIFMQHNWIY